MDYKTRELYKKELIFLEATLNRLQKDIKASGLSHYYGWGASRREEPNPAIATYNKLLPTYIKLLKDFNGDEDKADSPAYKK